jgi:uncharacterized protein (DUF2252 family)
VVTTSRSLPPTRFAPLSERRAWGKSRRDVVGRVDQGRWSPAKARPDVVTQVKVAAAGRLPELLPIKYGRMVASPFGFFRGAAAVMAADLARLPRTGMNVQICGDAHVRNLGAYAAPDGRVVFDINDFDESVVGPWEWDLKRLACSVVLAGREAGDSDRGCRDAVELLIASYREGLRRFAAMPAIELARYEIQHGLGEGPVHRVLRKAEQATPSASLEKFTVRGRGGQRRLSRRPPFLAVPEAVARRVLASLKRYRGTLGPLRQLVLDAYRPVDVAFRVAGTGSVGTRDYVVLCFGTGPDDSLFLQIKQELPSCYEPFLPRREKLAHEGRRAAVGQHRMQTVVDPFLGWTRIGGLDYLVRQLADHKASVDPKELKGAALMEYAFVCGELFAKAHARTGDAIALSAYCGRSDRLGRGLVRFATAYADQTAADHGRFEKAIRAGRIQARRVDS